MTTTMALSKSLKKFVIDYITNGAYKFYDWTQLEEYIEGLYMQEESFTLDDNNPTIVSLLLNNGIYIGKRRIKISDVTPSKDSSEKASLKVYTTENYEKKDLEEVYSKLQ